MLGNKVFIEIKKKENHDENYMRSFGENAISTIISAGIDLQGKCFSTALNLWFFFALELCSFFFISLNKPQKICVSKMKIDAFKSVNCLCRSFNGVAEKVV